MQELVEANCIVHLQFIHPPGLNQLGVSLLCETRISVAKDMEDYGRGIKS